MRANADALDALARLYGVAADGGQTAGAPSTTPGAAGGGLGPTSGVKLPTIDDLKNALMNVISKDGGKRSRVDPIIVKYAGALVKVDEIPAQHWPAVIAEAQAALAAAPPVTSVDDL